MNPALFSAVWLALAAGAWLWRVGRGWWVVLLTVGIAAGQWWVVTRVGGEQVVILVLGLPALLASVMVTGWFARRSVVSLRGWR